MKSLINISLAIATIAVVSASAVSGASAGGLYDGRGSMKDGPAVAHHGAAGPCYPRGDVGYSSSNDPIVRLESPNYPARGTDNEEIDGAWMGEIGIGCGSGSRGFRGDLTLGYRGERDITGIKTDRPGIHYPGTFESKISTLTAMANVYYDFGIVRGFVPYVGAGIGIAHHRLSSVSFDLRNPDPLGPPANPVNDLGGSSDTEFAWSLMAGLGYQISDRAVLDFGYRYIDMGDVSSRRGNMCNTCVPGGSQDRLSVEDITAHEFKVGLRYHFGGAKSSYK